MTSSESSLPVLGDLERAVLDHLWRTDDADVLETHVAVGRVRGISANTVGSALDRLHKKGLLSRRKVGHAYRYRACLDEEAYRARKVVEAAGGMSALGQARVLSAFVNLVAGAGGSALEDLGRLVTEKRLAQGDKS